MANNWIDYWDKANAFTEDNMRKNMEIFIRGSKPILNYGQDDIVLDIGCGPGNLEMHLKDEVREIHCLETSGSYIQLCKKRFRNSKNLFFYKLDPGSYTDFPFLRKKFSKIICLSVIQYYTSADDVEKLIKEVRNVALPGAKFLIADIPVKSSIFSDIAGLLKTAVKEGYLLDKLLYLYRLRASGYYRLRSSKKLLILPVERINKMIEMLDLDAKILKTRLTTNENRRHLLIQF